MYPIVLAQLEFLSTFCRNFFVFYSTGVSYFIYRDRVPHAHATAHPAALVLLSRRQLVGQSWDWGGMENCESFSLILSLFRFSPTFLARPLKNVKEKMKKWMTKRATLENTDYIHIKAVWHTTPIYMCWAYLLGILSSFRRPSVKNGHSTRR